MFVCPFLSLVIVIWSFLISKCGDFFIRGFSNIVELRGGFWRPYFVPFILKGFFVFIFRDLNS